MDITPKPSTYQQIIDNMKKIYETIIPGMTDFETRVTAVEKTVDTKITNPPETGDITNTDSGIKVVGITVVTTNSDIATGPMTYDKNVTYEYKKASVLGLPANSDFNDTYCLLVTYRNSDTAVTFKATQIVFNSKMVGYTRKESTDGTGWDAWEAIIKFPEIDIRKQIVDTDTMPTDQLEGEYWISSCDPVPAG